MIKINSHSKRNRVITCIKETPFKLYIPWSAGGKGANMARLYVFVELVGHPEPEKKILLAFLSTFWHPCSKCILMCFKKDRGGCQVWKCPKVPEIGQRSTECKFLYIRQILAFLSICHPKL